jgi:hypothetical protein
VQGASTYLLFNSCVVHLFLPDGGRFAAVTGVVVDTGFARIVLLRPAPHDFAL